MNKKIIGIVICTFLLSTIYFGAASAVAEDSWPMFAHDAANSGFSTTSAPKINDTLFIQGDVDGGIYGLIAEDGKVYACTFSGHLYCINAYNGSIIYDRTGFGEIVVTTPALYNGYLYFGSYNSNIYCVNASTGYVVWSYDTGSDYVISPPVIVDDKLFIGGVNKKMYCFDISNSPIIGLEWLKSLNGAISGSAAVVNDKVYVGTQSNKVYCLNANNGSIIWQYSTGGKVKTALSVKDDKVVFAASNDKLFCLDAVGNGAGTTDELWSYPITINNQIPTPVIYGDRVFIGPDGYAFFCININTGIVEWQCSTKYNCTGTIPAIADGKVYFDIINGFIYCVDADNGDQIWIYNNHPSEILAGIVAYNGIIYAGGSRLFAFGKPDIMAETPEKPEGPTEGQVGEKLCYTTTSPTYDEPIDVVYFFDWGDGTDSYWVPKNGVSSDKTYNQYHTYAEPGEYNIRVKAHKKGGKTQSPWSEPITVTIGNFSMSRITTNSEGILVEITNTGIDLDSCDWEIDVVPYSIIGQYLPGFGSLFKGHIFSGGYNTSDQGYAMPDGVVLPPGGTAKATCSVFGIGSVKINVILSSDGQSIQEKSATGVLIGRQIVIIRGG